MHAAPSLAVIDSVATGDPAGTLGLILAAADVDLGVSLAAVVVLGVGAQWLASRLGIPSILLLLLAGVVAGPDVTGLVDSDEMLGDLLFPAVSLAVGILLFEGGLGLRVRELDRQGAVPIVRLVTVGAAATWGIGALAAHQLVGLDRDAAILLGAILVVSGPTVVLPLLRFARVREPVNGILRWEGIVIDPIGATLGLVVVGAMTTTETTWTPAGQVASTALVGVVAGALGAALLTFVFDRHWVPDELHNPFTLAVVAAAFAAADSTRPEAGLFATTAMGVAMANQRRVPMSHIRDFEEDLGTLIIAGLFVVLGARVELALLGEWAPEALALLAVLVLVARPATVWLSTAGGGLSWRERAYLCCMAPRGIVAAATSALFALRLDRAGQPVEALVPVTFMIIVGTVVVYGLAARPMAERLRVARPDPRGVAFIGGPRWALELGQVLSDNDVPVLVVTRDPLEAAEAAEHGLFTYTRRLDAEDLRVALDSVGVAVAIATSRVQELNAYGITRAIGALGRANVYHLPAHEGDDEGEVDVETRRPFAGALTQAALDGLLARGGRIVALDADEVAAAVTDHGGETAVGETDRLLDEAVTLFTISSHGRPAVATVVGVLRPPAGGRGVYLVPSRVPPVETSEAGQPPEAGEPPEPG
jgi:NhaP-type Na+/H+ or K+/H+ antiporter